jgi:hypothetical protein
MNAMIESLPTHAGAVALRFSPDARLARRVSPTELELPLRPQMQFYPLKDGEQFIVHYPATREFRSHTVFGGCDESSFISGILAPAFLAFERGGERAFFEALTPDAVKELRELFPDALVQRQGDMWSIALPLDWKEVVMRCMISLNRPARRSLHWKKVTGATETSAVLGSNHRVNGLCSARTDVRIRDVIVDNVAVATGTITAPDHAPQLLGDGPNIIAQTPNLEPVDAQMRRAGYEPHGLM